MADGTGIKRSSIQGIKNQCLPLDPGDPNKLITFIEWLEGTRWTNEPYDAFQILMHIKTVIIHVELQTLMLVLTTLHLIVG